MFCSNCGTEATSNDRFCRSCGRELPRADSAASPDPAVPATPPGPAEPAPWGSSGHPGPTWSGQPAPALEANVWARPSNRLLTTPDGAPVLASVGRRIGAFGIDLVFAVVGFVGIALVIGFVFGIGLVIFGDLPEDGSISESQEESLGYFVTVAWAAVVFIATWIANATGGSTGKRILGLRIVREDLEAPGIATGLGRTLGAWLSWLAVGLGFLWGTWDDRGQTWHDKMAGTFVVRIDH